ncbi:protein DETOXIFICATION 53-like [Tripterygium wilfordii]|uniref:protein DETOXIFICATION 53-like n=1 Tax=Tripterygium wilfordii TaxID=458696 RepID=UPI0018F81A07|nr:protein DETOXIFICATION 53-like [Tripterygium wilfordii]
MQIGAEVMSLGKIACPIVLTTLLIYSRSIISMLFLSHLGRVELAGGSLAIAFSNISGQSLIKGLVLGMDPICGQAYGAKRWSVLSQTYTKTTCLLFLVSIPMIVLWLNIEPLFLFLGQDPDIVRVAKGYLAFSIPELLAQAVNNPLRTFLRTQGLSSALTVAAGCALVLHLPINYLFVIHVKLGVKGVALAMACNTINLNIGLLIYVLASKESIKPWHGVTIASIFQGWWPLLSLAVPSCLSVCLEWWWYEIIIFLCGLLKNPDACLAAMGILIQTEGIFYSFPYAMSCSISTRIGHALGANQPSRAKWSATIGLSMAIGFGLTISGFLVALKSVWGKLYTNEQQVLDLVTAALPIIGLCELGNSPQTAACGVLTGTARPKDGARINLCAFYLIGLPVSVLATFKFKLGFPGLWLGLLAAQFSCVCMMGYTLLHTDWRHQAKRADELTLAAGGGDDLESPLLTNP